MTLRALWLIRHAESVWNAERRWQGHADPALSPRGDEQARQLGERLSGERIDRVFASDLRRALETARPLARAHACEPIVDSRLRELDVGRWEGRRRTEIERFDAAALERFDRGDPDAPAGGGESRAQVERRARAALLELAERHAGPSLAVVTHLGVLRALRPGPDLENAGFERIAGPDLEHLLGLWRGVERIFA